MRNLIEFHENHVKKTFVVTDVEEKKHITDNFNRELTAYKKFAQLNVDFVPKLLQYDSELLILEIEKVNGLDLVDLFKQNEKEVCANINNDMIIDQLISIDAFLYNNKINVLQLSPKDIILDYKQNKIFLIDFEYTIINSSYKQVLCDRMFHDRLLNLDGNELKDLFCESLKKRRTDFTLYHYRKMKNIFIKCCRSYLPLQSKKKYKQTKIKVSY